MTKRGRPRTFDRAQAIDDAMRLFWQNGYDSTTLSQLKAGIAGGITAPSFYAAFGSKEQLFKEVVERYVATHGRSNESLFDPAIAPRDAIELALKRSVHMQASEDSPKGCLVALGTMTTCIPGSEALQEPLRAARAQLKQGIYDCVVRGIDQGELRADVQPEALATVFEVFLLGTSTLLRDGASLALLESAVDRLMSIWDAHRVS